MGKGLGIGKSAWLVVVLVLACGQAAGAEPAAQSDQAASAAEPKEQPVNPNKRVCKRIKPTGTHFSQRVCLKQKDWDELRESSAASMRESPGGPQ